jgi:hypothetical protein
MLIALGCGAGGVALRNGKPENWTDVIAPGHIVQRTAWGLAGMTVLLAVSGVLVFLSASWGCLVGVASTLLFVLAGFWGNKVMFGDYRPKHTVTNTVIVGVIWILIWAGYPN